MSIGGHHSARAQSVDYFTEQWIIDALGGAPSFDLDPATALLAPNQTARAICTREDDGLRQSWDGRVWLNPPYTNRDLHAFMMKLARHGRGTALIFARTETRAFFETVWREASGLLFLEGRLHFLTQDGVRLSANAGAPSVLVAYGADDMDILAAARLDGQFVPLRLPRSVVMAALEPSWRQAVASWMGQQRGPVKLDELYRAFASHPKAARNQNWRPKLRQIVQQLGRRVGPAEWVMA